MPSERRRTGPIAADAVGVVVPIRSFRLGKARLAEVIDDDARRALAREMASRVVDAAAGAPVAVITSDDEVGAWARDRRLTVLGDPGSLDGAAELGRTWAAGAALAHVAVVHADLPLVTSLAPVLDAVGPARCVLVPCHRDDGTPVLALPVDAPLRFAYGPGSFARHRAAAERAGLTVEVVTDPTLRFDVDVPADLVALDARVPRPA